MKGFYSGKRLAWFLANFSILILMHGMTVGCGGGKKTTVTTVGGSDTDTDTGTDMDTTDTSFDTTSTSNLFDTDIAQSEVTDANPNLGPVSQVENACLTSNSAFGLQSNQQTGYYATNTSTTATAYPVQCLNSGNSWDPNSLYDAGVNSLGQMSQCLSLVLGHEPSAGTPPQLMTVAFREAQFALVRCYRNVLQQQMQFGQWNQQSQSAYQYNDSNMYSILLLLSQGW